eukprot:CAMPEP_0204648366 /NCGR_PEP_ID=MMETSP0718-20130828/7638_1 /ASSEMBLY_ACC=CAM_ASM_000674 /TAXON_ID=230516 /ORGANISM="Chaetoceros curvisetus" /LENGTH=65 /DNA_ID=CAMNT_0051671169 /DNA_START=119 /DNA_END=316 /DNA_ORIENTATION=+
MTIDSEQVEFPVRDQITKLGQFLDSKSHTTVAQDVFGVAFSLLTLRGTVPSYLNRRASTKKPNHT